MSSVTVEDRPIEKIYWSIGEVARKLNVAPSLIRFWDSEFPTLQLRRTRRRDRLFTKSDLDMLHLIYRLVKVEGYTLTGARRQIELRKLKTIADL